MLRRESGQRVPAWALILSGVSGWMDYIDAWNGAWPAFVIVFALKLRRVRWRAAFQEAHEHPYPLPCLARDTAAAVADGITFLALRMAITTSATRRVCTCCQSGKAPSPDEGPALSGM